MFVVFGPEVVCLNRGNHEDLPVCRVYGFEQEVKEKYDELLFEIELDAMAPVGRASNAGGMTTTT